MCGVERTGEAALLHCGPWKSTATLTPDEVLLTSTSSDVKRDSSNVSEWGT